MDSQTGTTCDTSDDENTDVTNTNIQEHNPFSKFPKLFDNFHNNDSKNHDQFQARSKNFNIFLNSIIINEDFSNKLTLKNHKFLKLLKLFQNSENYYTTMLLNNENSNLLQFKRLNNKLIMLKDIDLQDLNNTKYLLNDYYLCHLCLHTLCEPVTLICGCTYCKSCLDEYNRVQVQRKKQYDLNKSNNKRMNKKKLAINNSTSVNNLYKCKICDYIHQNNSIDHLKTNIYLFKCMEKLFGKYIDDRLLRGDLRRYILLKKFDFNFIVLLFEHAFKNDETNHLLLADLFLLHYFNDSYDKCLELSEKAIKLVPNWPFAYFMRALSQEDSDKVRADLLHCLELDSKLDRIRLILINLPEESKNEKVEIDQSQATNEESNKKRPCLFTQIVQVESDSSLQNQKSKKFHSSHSADDVIKQDDSEASCSAASAASLDDDTKAFNNNNNNNKYKTTTDQFYFDLAKSSEESTSSSSSEPSSPKLKTKSDDSIDGMLRKNTPMIESDSNNTSKQGVTTETEKALNKFQTNTETIKTSDLECSLCYRLFYNPVSTNCGHVFCRGCLDRSLDHQDRCPLCKSSLSDYLAERRQFITKSIDNLIQTVFPSEYSDRKKQYDDEIYDLVKNECEIPIFVCTLALPTVPCMLHIFEPRYRLMIRRALATTKRFGMCLYAENEEDNYVSYGCTLLITMAKFLTDGRVLLETVGDRRFRVIERSMKDGYNMARVEWIKDNPIVNEDERLKLCRLKEMVHASARCWFGHLPEDKKNKVKQYYGQDHVPDMIESEECSENGPNWVWFIINILPLEKEFQMKFLSTSSLTGRLIQLKIVLQVLLKAFERDQTSSNSDTQATTAQATPQ